MKITILFITAGLITFAGAISVLFRIGFNSYQVLFSQAVLISVVLLFLIIYKKRYSK